MRGCFVTVNKIVPQRLTDQFEGWVAFLVFPLRKISLILLISSFSFHSFYHLFPVNLQLPNMLSFCVIISISCCDTELKWTGSSPTESASPPIPFSFKGGGGCPPRAQRQAWQDEEVRWELAEQLCPWNIWVKYTCTHFYTKNKN